MRENSIIKENILKYLDFKGFSKYEFYKNTGISNGILSQKNGMSEENILRFLSYYKEVNPGWVITGIGSMLSDECSVAIKTNEPTTGIPLVSTEVAAGFGTANFSIKDEDIQAHYLVPDFNGIDFMIRVKGSSMYPKYSSGDIVACRILRDSKFIQWNKCYVVATREQGLLVKRLKKGSSPECLLALSDNKEYDPFEIPQEEITGIALVVGVIRLE